MDNQVWEHIPSRKYEKMKYLAHVVIYTECFWKEYPNLRVVGLV